VHAHVQGLVSVVKMVTVLEECTTDEEHFLCAEVLSGKDIHK
jgi:hypothetical protein